MFRTLGLVCVWVWLLCTDAMAICGPGLAMSVFYDEVPSGVDAPVVLEVTIVKVADPDERGGTVGTGRIERVIKGDITLKTISVFAPYEECFIGFSVGTHGIVLGSIHRDKRGDLELLAKSDRAWKGRFQQGLDLDMGGKR